jgi:L-2-hydroxyglutarate oxidase
MLDVIIAGAGIVGLATGLKILEKRPRTKLLVIDKEDGVAKHQTGHNSGVIHSGIYYKPGSLKALNCIKGYKLLIEFCNKNGIEYNICGKVICATEEKEIIYLNTLYERGLANGLEKIRKINKEELKEIEPYANGINAIHVPYTGIIDFKIVSEKYSSLIQETGGIIRFKEKVIKISTNEKGSNVITNSNSFNSKFFVNCCGLQSDEVAKLNNGASNLRIIPFRGEYYKIRKDKQYLVHSLIYPVPNPDFPFLGVHFTRMIEGGVEAGPNAVLSFKKEGYKKSDISLKDLAKIFAWKGFHKVVFKYYKIGMGEFYRSYRKKAFVKALQKLLPEIKSEDLETGGSGVRAQAVDINGKLIDDFVIENKGGIFNVLSAPSPAATSSLSIGETIANEILKNLN